jgi:hypothetical protein
MGEGCLIFSFLLSFVVVWSGTLPAEMVEVLLESLHQNETYTNTKDHYDNHSAQFE